MSKGEIKDQGSSASPGSGKTSPAVGTLNGACGTPEPEAGGGGGGLESQGSGCRLGHGFKPSRPS